MRPVSPFWPPSQQVWPETIAESEFCHGRYTPNSRPWFIWLFALASVLLSTFHARAEEAPIATGQKTNGKARAEILSLKRTEGNTLTLKFAVVNNGNSSLSITTSNLKLIDLVNRRSYGAGVSSPCVADPDQRVICRAVFAAPSAGVKTINVEFYEDFGLISTPIAD